MPSWLPHVFVPVAVGLLLLPVPRRLLLAWAPLAWAPDLDYLVPALHRAATHSLLLPAILLGVLLGSWRALDPRARFAEYATRPGHPVHLTLAAYYLAGHSFLDVFAGGVVLLWPLLDTNVFLGFEVLLLTETNELVPDAYGGTSEGAPALAPVYAWMSYVDTATLAFVAVALAASGAIRWAGRGAPRPVVVRRTATRAGPGVGASAPSGNDKRRAR